MDRNTIVRIAIPLSLYESVKGKVLNEADKKSEQDKLNDPEYLKKLQAAVEKARKGNSTDLAILMNLPQGMNEAKKTVDPAKKKADAKKAEADKKKAEIKKAAEKKKAEAEKKK